MVKIGKGVYVCVLFDFFTNKKFQWANFSLSHFFSLFMCNFAKNSPKFHFTCQKSEIPTNLSLCSGPDQKIDMKSEILTWKSPKVPHILTNFMKKIDMWKWKVKIIGEIWGQKYEMGKGGMGFVSSMQKPRISLSAKGTCGVEGWEGYFDMACNVFVLKCGIIFGVSGVLPVFIALNFLIFLQNFANFQFFSRSFRFLNSNKLQKM